MRFKKWPRHAFTDTHRKRVALRRKQRLERESLPLFAEQIAEEQPSEDRVMQDRAKAWSDQELRDRQARADKWRDARRRIAALSDDDRRAFRRVWDCAPYPADPSRLLGVLDNHARGQIDLRHPPFPMSPTDGAGIRRGDLFAKPDMAVSLLEARDIASDPDGHSLIARRAAYHTLQTAASTTKDRKRAMRDRVLASALFLRLGELEETNA